MTKKAKNIETRGLLQARRNPEANETTGVYAGSFDPITNGHLDVIRRAARLFDRVVIAVGASSTKAPLFDLEERLAMIDAVCRPLTNVSAAGFSGLAVEFAKAQGAICLVRGLRNEPDFSYEMQMALMNRCLSPELESIFIPTAQEFAHISSSLVKEIAAYRGKVSDFVPPEVSKRLAEKLHRRK